MKNLILVLLVALSFYSCTDSPQDEVVVYGNTAYVSKDDVVDCGKTTNVPYERFSNCESYKESIKKLSFMTFNSKEEYTKVYMLCETLLPFEFPDLTEKRILGLFAGEKPTSGYFIKIQSVVEDNCQITVEYFEKEPKLGDPVFTFLTYPSDFILLPKSNKPIVLKRVNEMTDADESKTLMGVYTETSPVRGRSQLKFIEGNKVIRTEPGSSTSDEFIYELSNNRIKLTPTWGSVLITELDFEIINSSKFKIKNLYPDTPGIREIPTFYMTFEK